MIAYRPEGPSFSQEIAQAYRIAESIRAVGVPVVMGGLHVTDCR